MFLFFLFRTHTCCNGDGFPNTMAAILRQPEPVNVTIILPTDYIVIIYWLSQPGARYANVCTISPCSGRRTSFTGVSSNAVRESQHSKVRTVPPSWSGIGCPAELPPERTMSGVISTLCKFDVAACVEVTQRPLLPRTDS